MLPFFFLSSAARPPPRGLMGLGLVGVLFLSLASPSTAFSLEVWSPTLLLDFGPNLGRYVPVRVQRHLERWLGPEATATGKSLSPGAVLKCLLAEEGATAGCPVGPTLLLSLGDTKTFDVLRAAAWAKAPFPGEPLVGSKVLGVAGCNARMT
jgi:hypothetical protein